VVAFDRGDIVFLSLEPVVGREMQGGHRYALVLTTKEFNALGVNTNHDTFESG